MENIRGTKKGVAGSILIVLAVLGAVFFFVSVFAERASAEEASGMIIKELVQDINNKAKAFDRQNEDFDQVTGEYNQKLKTQAKRYDKAKRDITRRQILSEMLLTRAKLNKEELESVRAYKQTLQAMLPKMKRLKGELAKLSNSGFENSQKFQQFKINMGRTAANSIEILEKLKKSALASTPRKRERDEIIRNFEMATGMYSKKPSYKNGQPDTTQINRSIRKLETAFAQMTCVEKALQMERLRLKSENLQQLSELVLERFAMSRLSFQNIATVPRKMLMNITERDTEYRKRRDQLSMKAAAQEEYTSYSSSISAERLNKLWNGDY